LGVTEMNRIRMVLYDINNSMFGPYLAAINRILISVVAATLRTYYPSTKHTLTPMHTSRNFESTVDEFPAKSNDRPRKCTQSQVWKKKKTASSANKTIKGICGFRV
jgi:hypothetical protein